MREVVIVDSVRTGLAKSFRGKFNQTRPDDMAAHCVNALLARNHGLIASFSRALTEGLTATQTEVEFDALLAESIESIYQASIT